MIEFQESLKTVFVLSVEVLLNSVYVCVTWYMVYTVTCNAYFHLSFLCKLSELLTLWSFSPSESDSASGSESGSGSEESASRSESEESEDGSESEEEEEEEEEEEKEKKKKKNKELKKPVQESER